jgi:hypothetical protein
MTIKYLKEKAGNCDWSFLSSEAIHEDGKFSVPVFNSEDR